MSLRQHCACSVTDPSSDLGNVENPRRVQRRRGDKLAPADAQTHYAAIDVLSPDIRRYTAAMFKPGMPYSQVDLLTINLSVRSPAS
jgi:hypothetical protein